MHGKLQGPLWKKGPKAPGSWLEGPFEPSSRKKNERDPRAQEWPAQRAAPFSGDMFSCFGFRDLDSRYRV